MKQLYVFLIGLAPTFTCAQQTTAPDSDQIRVWVTLGTGLTSFGDWVVGSDINVSKGTHLYSVDYQFYPGAFNLFFCDTPEPSMEQFSAFYGYIKHERTRFWYAKAGLSYLLYSSASDTLPSTGWFSCDKYIYETTRHFGLPIEIGAGVKLWAISFQAYGSVLISGPVTTANLGLKVGLGYLK